MIRWCRKFCTAVYRAIRLLQHRIQIQFVLSRIVILHFAKGNQAPRDEGHWRGCRSLYKKESACVCLVYAWASTHGHG